MLSKAKHPKQFNAAQFARAIARAGFASSPSSSRHFIDATGALSADIRFEAVFCADNRRMRRRETVAYLIQRRRQIEAMLARLKDSDLASSSAALPHPPTAADPRRGSVPVTLTLPRHFSSDQVGA